ncbi:UNKNOWN [Stylonychia lemnae]|uniref:Nbr1 FW domain-containing protein n=1 Tax=Stylonychia lemnae TaxID=5949 RepID=A0A078ARG5_STYLE|nr:UNKNOWN [Stylonychia lemnae]|eukprot:CDW84571.1 UNKNOWN [Stylonychia lemnae]
MSNPQEIKRVEWLKISLDDKLKRIFNPSKDLKCLSNQVKSHFRELNDFILVNTPEVMEKEFALQWVTPQQKIIISDNDQLEEIYLMHSLSVDNKIPRFEIVAVIDGSLNQSNMRQSSIRNSELKNSMIYTEQNGGNIINDGSQFQSCYPSQSSIDRYYQQQQQKFDENLNPIQNPIKQSLLDELKSEESEEFEDSRSYFDSSEDEEEEDKKIMLTMRHFIRLEVEKKCIQYCEEDDDLKQMREKFELSSFNIQGQQEEEEEKIEYSQLIDVQQLKSSNLNNDQNKTKVDISVSMTSKMNESLTQSQILKFPFGLSTFKNFFSKKQMPQDRQLYAMILGQAENYLEAEVGTQCTLKWQIQNKARIQWPKGKVELVHIYSSPLALIENKKLDGILQPNESEEIQVGLFIPKDIKENYQIVLFRLRDKDGYFFGQPLIAIIKVLRNLQSGNLDQSQSLSQSMMRQSVVSIRKSSTEDFSAYNLSDEQLLGMASVLFDEGYGSFDRCYGIVRALRGDMKRAKETLSQLIFYECQF